METQYKRSRTKKYVITALVIGAIILIVGVILLGYLISKNKDKTPVVETTEENLYLNPQTDTSFVKTLPVNPPGQAVLGANTEVPPVAPPANPPATLPPPAAPVAVGVRTYTNANVGFSIQIPTDWVVEPAGNEVVVKTPANARYSIQSYAVPNTDPNSLKSFLQSLPNLHQVTEATIVGRSGFTFTVDGFYGRGYAFLFNGKIYYLLGNGIQDSAVVKTFKLL